MKTTFKKLMQLGVVLAVTAGVATTALAAVPNDAGFKARGMKNAPVYRTYAAPQIAVPQATARQAFSYVPQMTTERAMNCPEQAAAPAVQNQVRRFSYEPTAPAPVYRTWTNRGGQHGGYYGGNYPSKANLKY